MLKPTLLTKQFSLSRLKYALTLLNTKREGSKLAETLTCLDWVQLWRVSDVVDGPYVQRRPPVNVLVFEILALVNCQLIHE
jgi:hypothetical protein